MSKVQYKHFSTVTKPLVLDRRTNDLWNISNKTENRETNDVLLTDESKL